MNETQQVENFEEKGRNLFKIHFTGNTYIQFIAEAKQRYTPWDVAIISGNTKMLVEIKYRNASSTTYPDWILEGNKIDEMHSSLSGKTDIKLIYCNIFEDNKIALWDITNIEASLESKECTAKQYGPKYKKNKQVHKLKLNQTFLFETI